MALRVALVEKPSRSGIGTYTAGLLANLPPRIEATVAKVKSWEVRVLGRGFGGTLTPRLLRLEPPIPDSAQVVHATSNHAFPRQADVLTLHDLNPLLLPGFPLERTLLRLQAKRIRALSAVITPSEPVRAHAIRVYGLDPRQVVTIPNGIDHAAFHPAPATPATAPADGIQVLYVGDWRPYKGILEAVAACSQLRGARLVRCGPPPTDAWGRAALVHAAETLGSRFVDAGYVDAAALRSLYVTSDLVWFPSRYEGFGLPPLEAAACGTQSLVWDNDLNRAHLGDAGVFVRTLTPDAVAQRVRDAVRHPVPESKLLAAAAPFTWRETARRTADVYEAVAT